MIASSPGRAVAEASTPDNLRVCRYPDSIPSRALARPSQSPMSLLEVNNLQKSFGSLRAVDGVSFAVAAGEIFGLLGPNGAGKSTTMMMLAGLLPPDGGDVSLDGRPFNPTDYAQRMLLGVVPQDLAIYPELTARENLRFFGKLYGVKGARLAERVDFALERIGLVGRADDQAGTYSGGMKRRLNFGTAILHTPKLLILDEPTVGVDPQSRAHLLDCVRDLAAEGMAVIYASHYMEEVQTICQRVAIVDHGKVLANDTLHGLLSRLSSDLCLRIATPPDAVLARFAKMAEVKATGEGETTLVLARDHQGDEAALNRTLNRVLSDLQESDVRVIGIETHEPNLERLFLQLTGSKLRD